MAIHFANLHRDGTSKNFEEVPTPKSPFDGDLPNLANASISRKLFWHRFMGPIFCKGFWKFRWNGEKHFLQKFPEAVGLKDVQYLYLKLQIWKLGQNSEVENDSLRLRLFLQISLPWQTHKDRRGGFACHGPGRAWTTIPRNPTLKSNLLKTTPQIYGGFRDLFGKFAYFVFILTW